MAWALDHVDSARKRLDVRPLTQSSALVIQPLYDSRLGLRGKRSRSKHEREQKECKTEAASGFWAWGSRHLLREHSRAAAWKFFLVLL
jgi:hypothetical protein